MTNLGELSLGLPLSCKGVVVAPVKLARDLARDAHGSSGGAGIGHGPGDVGGAGDAGSPVVHDGGGDIRRGAPAAGNSRIPHTEVLHQAGKGHCFRGASEK